MSIRLHRFLLCAFCAVALLGAPRMALAVPVSIEPPVYYNFGSSFNSGRTDLIPFTSSIDAGYELANPVANTSQTINRTLWYEYSFSGYMCSEKFTPTSSSVFTLIYDLENIPVATPSSFRFQPFFPGYISCFSPVTLESSTNVFEAPAKRMDYWFSGNVTVRVVFMDGTVSVRSVQSDGWYNASANDGKQIRYVCVSFSSLSGDLPSSSYWWGFFFKPTLLIDVSMPQLTNIYDRMGVQNTILGDIRSAVQTLSTDAVTNAISNQTTSLNNATSQQTTAITSATSQQTTALTDATESQTDTLMDTSGSGDVFSDQLSGAEDQLEVGVFGQFDGVLGQFRDLFLTTGYSSTVHFPGIVVQGITLVPEQDVSLWQNGLSQFQTPVRVICTFILFVAWFNGMVWVFQHQILGIDLTGFKGGD